MNWGGGRHLVVPPFFGVTFEGIFVLSKWASTTSRSSRSGWWIGIGELLWRTRSVKKRLHRGEEEGDLAQGDLLPGVPTGSLVVLAGHRKLFHSGGDRHRRNSALATGCSVWAKAAKKGVRVEAIATCMCGRRMPSRPHLLWRCDATAHLRPNCALPVNRAEERMLCRVVPELPAAPGVVGEDEVIDDLAAELEKQLGAGAVVFVATDGSCVKDVAAWAVAVQDGPVFCSGIIGEDQSPYRAEVEGIRRLLMAAQLVRGCGRLVVISDCQAAILTVNGKGQASLLAEDVRTRWRAVRAAGIDVSIHWVPSHGKPAPAVWQVPPGGEVPARVINGRADVTARDLAVRRVTGSAREACHADRVAAAAWEEEAILGLARIADFYDSR